MNLAAAPGRSTRARGRDALLVPLGVACERGERHRRSARALFGLMTHRAWRPRPTARSRACPPSPGSCCCANRRSRSRSTAYVRGHVAEVLPGEGVVVEARGALLQGIFGVGGETFGPDRDRRAPAPSDELRAELMLGRTAARSLVGGAYVSHDTLDARARAGRGRAWWWAASTIGTCARCSAATSASRSPARRRLGHHARADRGLRPHPMADRTWDLLREAPGAVASVSGATQIRAGVMRPEILIPLEGRAGCGPAPTNGRRSRDRLAVRVIRAAALRAPRPRRRAAPRAAGARDRGAWCACWWSSSGR